MSQLPEFKLLLKLHRQQLTPKERAKTRFISPPRSLYPIAIEEIYAQRITDIQKELVNFVESKISALVPKLVERVDDLHTDDILDQEYEQIQQEIQNRLVAIYGTSIMANKTIQAILASVAEKTRAFRETGFSKQILAIAGIPFVPQSPNWRNIKAAWELTNYTLIKNLSTEYIQKINTVVLTGIQAGWTTEEIAKELTMLGDKISGYRARLIARDQMGKLNNKITRDLYLNVGIRCYMWNTARDERVRGNPHGKYPKAIPSHWLMDSKICRFDDSTVYTPDAGKTWIPRTADMSFTEPGLEILCRCVTSPIAFEIIDEVDADIRQQGVY